MSGKERKDRSRLYVDENEQYFVQKNIGSQLEKVDSPEGLAELAEKDKQERENDAEALKNAYPHYEFYPVDKVKFPIQIRRNTKCENKIR